MTTRRRAAPRRAPPEIRSRRSLRTVVTPSRGSAVPGAMTVVEVASRRGRRSHENRSVPHAGEGAGGKGKSSAASAGFALPSAIFLLVILALLGAFMASIAVWQHKGTADDVQGTRALLAARAGADWGLHRVTQAATCAGGTFVPPGAALADFTVTVACSATTATEAGTGVTVYLITATACNQPSGGNCPNTTSPGAYYVERQWSAAVSQ